MIFDYNKFVGVVDGDSSFDNKEALIRYVRHGKEKIPGCQISYPLTYLDEGVYANVYEDNDGRIVRFSENANDHYVNMLSRYINVIPRVSQSVVIGNVSVTVRDDVPGVEDEAFEDVIDLSGADDWLHYYGLKNTILIEGGFMNCVKRLFFHNFPPDAVLIFLTGIRTAMKEDNAEILRSVILDARKNAFNFTFDDDHCRFEVMIMNPKNGLVDFSESVIYENVLNSITAGITEMCVQYPHHKSRWTEFLDMMISFINEMGIIPIDLHSDNIGEVNGKLIFRDPYGFAEKYGDYQIRVGQHRKRMGLPVPDEWNIHPTKVDAIILSMREKGVNLVYTQGAEYNTTTGDRCVVVSPSDMRFVIDTLADYIPLSEGDRYVHVCTEEEVRRAYKALGITESPLIESENFVQKVPFVNKDTHSSEHKFVMKMYNTLNKTIVETHARRKSMFVFDWFFDNPDSIVEVAEIFSRYRNDPEKMGVALDKISDVLSQTILSQHETQGFYVVNQLLDAMSHITVNRKDEYAEVFDIHKRLYEMTGFGLRDANESLYFGEDGVKLTFYESPVDDYTIVLANVRQFLHNQVISLHHADIYSFAG